MGNVEGKEGTGEGDAASTSSSKAAWNFCEPSRVGSSVAGQEVEEVDKEELEERQKSGKGGISWLFRSKVMDMKLDKQTKLHSLGQPCNLPAIWCHVMPGTDRGYGAASMQQTPRHSRSNGVCASARGKLLCRPPHALCGAWC